MKLNKKPRNENNFPLKRLFWGLILLLLIGLIISLSYYNPSLPGFQTILKVVTLAVLGAYFENLFYIIRRTNSQATNIIIISLFFGIVCGVMEAVIFLASESAGRLNGIAFEIIWISPLTTLLIFNGIGYVLALVSQKWTNPALISMAIFVFSFLSFFDWIALITFGKIHLVACFLLATGISAEIARRFKNQSFFFDSARKILPWSLVGLIGLFIVVEAWPWTREAWATANLSRNLSKPTNVLVIVIDALRSDHLSSYDYQRETSPNIDRLAQAGVVFSHAFSTTSYTLPSHVSLLTGLNPSQHGVEWDTPMALKDKTYPTISELMQRLGYRTAAFSGNTFWFSQEEGFDQGFIHFEDFFTTIADMAMRSFYGRGFEQYLMRPIGLEDIPARKRASNIIESSLQWIKKDKGKPFFVFINFMDVHDPYLPPEPYRTMFTHQEDVGGILNWRVGRTDPPLTPEELQSEIDAYDGAIRYTDDQIGYLLEQLDSEGLLVNTLVIVTSDHGEAFGEHELFLHAHSLYREVIEVPLIFYLPSKIPSGIKIYQPISTISLPATILDILEANNRHEIQGPSLVKLWNTTAITEWPDPLSELERQPWTSENYPVQKGWLKSLVSDDWHLIQSENKQVELFKWIADPKEQENLADHSDNQMVLCNLQKKLLRIYSPC
jgi:arylsulfatase A-like enzyme